jgi:hydroxymethylpyrimidine/phosphomethylpyrimidine kinase
MSLPPPPVLLTIAGHDPSSGAGITADLQVFAAFGCFGTSAVTALTVQSTLGVSGSHPTDSPLLTQVLDRLVSDLSPQGIKVGMLASAPIARTVADFLHSLPSPTRNLGLPTQKQGIETGSAPAPAPRTSSIPIVLDPILRASSGASLLDHASLDTLHLHLLPLVTWITPNWPELSALTGLRVTDLAEAEAAAHSLAARHPHLHIVATGGDQTQPTDLLRLPSGEFHLFTGEHIASTSTHGTGCAFSSALLSRLVLGDTAPAAVLAAKLYVTEAIRRAPNLGHGRGPMNLLWPLL